MTFEQNEKGVLVPAHGSKDITRMRIRGGQIFTCGKYIGEIRRQGKIVDTFEFDNLVTDEGLNHLLDVALAAGSQITSWYLGVFEGNYTPVAGDTAAGIAAASTESSAYSGGVRPAWTPGAVASKTVSNSASRASFTFSASKTIYGAFMISSAVINGTSGKLLSAARFSSSKSVQSGDELLLTYQFTSSSV